MEVAMTGDEPEFVPGEPTTLASTSSSPRRHE
jgi:hypothetical protein